MASASAGGTDELLLALMSMGFEYENCMKVIEDGVTVLEIAVERLMNPEQSTAPQQPAAIPPRQPSSLTEEPHPSSSQTQPEDKIKSRYERQRREQEEYDKNELKAAEMIRKKQKMEERKLKQNILKEIASDRKQFKVGHDEETTGTSSNTEDVKDRKKREKEEYERKQKEMHSENWKKMQMNKRKERQRVLAAIEQDKQKNKEAPVPSKTDTTAHAQTTSSSSDKKANCRIQAVFPDGTHQTFTLPADHPLQELYELCKGSVVAQESEYAFVQTFPRRTIQSEQFKSSFKDLGLCPSCKLIFKQNDQQQQQQQPTSPVSEDPHQAPQEEDVITDPHDDESMSVSGETDDGGSEASSPAPPAMKRPCRESRLLQGNIDNRIDDFNDNDDDDNRPDDGGNDDNDVANASVIQEAIQRRLAAKVGGNVDSAGGSRKMMTLQKLVAVYVATQLLKKQPYIVEYIGKLNPKAAEFIVGALKRSNNLSVEILNFLQPCKLKEINFDMCRLASLDLVYALKSHHNLRKISLKSVTCVTDRTVENLVKSIHRLSYLNLSDCDGIVGSFLTSSHGLSKLKTLILNRTKLKDDYIRSFLRMEVSKDLNELSLNNCTHITNNAFALDKDYPSVVAISIDETQVNSLSFLKNFSNLYSLSVKKTELCDEDMKQVAALRNITSLELNATKITDRGLAFIKDKNLTRFSFPDRLCVNNDSICVIEGFNLTILDLTNFVYIDDGCFHSICQVKSLKHLYLSQIPKITDTGVLQLQALHDLETLNLRNTNVTSNISPVLTALPFLHTVDLAGTKVCNLIFESLSRCLQIVKLNLSHTTIDDEGMKSFGSPKLATLTLDSTSITMPTINRIALKCPRLSWVRNASNNVLFTRDFPDM